ncbi:hypothetical protein V0U79_03950 [Hyphobacterium sp. HN65]|uniref:Uncharacterized protein n=1 Tax=Hyphobacterium lacteum TaxID=3116575 RepID=A0ABU7LNK3_9PROT|nr:hypothetical protein [Hyphobacterium sp. HN65]MEE2525506.1 hypothetical protein [Hyphobacterium sp. HN65]
MLTRRRSVTREETNAIASRASEAALAALGREDFARARDELSVVPRRVEFAESGWKVALVNALTDLAAGKRKNGINTLIKVFQRLDDTGLTQDDKGYLRLFALYRAIEHSKDGRAPAALRDHAEDFRFDTTLVDPALKALFPLKRVEQKADDIPPPPFPAGMGSSEA